MYKRAVRSLSEAERDLEAANKEIAARSPEGRQSHIVLADDWIPTSVADGDELIEYVDALLAETREELRAPTCGSSASTPRLMATSAAIDGFQAAYEMGGDDSATTTSVPVFDGTPEEARVVMRTRLKDRTEATELVAQAEAQRWDALNDVKDVARDEVWSTVTSPIRERCRLGDADDLALQAAGADPDAPGPGSVPCRRPPRPRPPPRRPRRPTPEPLHDAAHPAPRG